MFGIFFSFSQFPYLTSFGQAYLYNQAGQLDNLLEELLENDFRKQMPFRERVTVELDYLRQQADQQNTVLSVMGMSMGKMDLALSSLFDKDDDEVDKKLGTLVRKFVKFLDSRNQEEV